MTDVVPSALTILLAEDESMLRMVAAEVLADAGFTVKEAPDGAAALKVLESDTKIDLLISDIKMPGLNGYQLAQAAFGIRPNLKVLFMTGYAQDPAPPSLAGIQVLYKPFDFDRLPVLANEILATA